MNRRALWFLVALALAGAPAASAAQGDATAGLAVGPTIGAPFLDDHAFVGLAILDDGAFALVGSRTIPTETTAGGYQQFEVQLFTPDDTIVRTLVPYPPATWGGIGSLGNRYFLSWQYFPQATRAALVDRRGGMDEPVPWLNSLIDYYGTFYRYGGGPAYHFLPITFRIAGQLGGEPNFQPLFQAFDSNASPLGPPLSLAPRSDWIFLYDAAINGRGRFVLLYQRCVIATFPASCYDALQVFRGAGVQETGEVTGDFPRLTLGVPLVAVENSGKFLMAWVAALTDRSDPLFVRLFDPQGRPLTPPLKVTEGVNVGLAGVRSLANGSFVFTWIAYSADGSQSFYASSFDAATGHFTAPVLVVHDFLSGEGFHFEMNQLGKGIVTWTTLNKRFVFTGHFKHLTALPPESSDAQ
jgi:hypothetical protein